MLSTVRHYRKYIAARLKYYRRLDIVEELLIEAEPLLWQKWTQDRRHENAGQRKRFLEAYRTCCPHMTRIIVQWIARHGCDDTLCESYSEMLEDMAMLFLENGKLKPTEVAEIMRRKPRVRLEHKYNSREWDNLGKDL